MGPKIIENENTDDNLRCLAAQRELYTEAKKIFFWQIVLATIIVVLLSFLDVFYDIEWVVAAYSITITIGDLIIISPLIASKKEKAAKIQEYFDTTVLEIPWNQVFVGDKPGKEDIFRYSEKYVRKSKFDAFKNWYSEKIEEVDTDAAKIIYQRSNCVYDYSIRDSFSKLIIVTLIIAVIFILIIGFLKGLTLQNFFLLVGLPALPMMILLIKMYKNNKVSKESLTSLKGAVDSVWANTLKGHQPSINKIARELQDKIFLNRKNSPLIFDWYYEKNRHHLEDEMHYSVEQLVKEYKKQGKIKLKAT